MKLKTVLLLSTVFLAILACSNPLVERVFPKDEKNATLESSPDELESSLDAPGILPTVSYTVTFDSDGGSPVDNQTVAEGAAATRPENPIKGGYGFVNWYDNEALSEPHYDFATPVTGDITLFAEWSQTFHTVIFDSNGGSDVDDQTVGENGTASRLVPTKNGYTFDDWYRDPELTDRYDFDTPVTEGITLHAKWTLNTYTVTFMDNGTVLTAFTLNNVGHGSTVNRSPTNPSKEGYTFDNWYSDSGLTALFNFSTPITENTTVYAKFNLVPVTYTVTFNSNGGTPQPAPQTGLIAGAYAAAVADPSKPFSADDLEAGLYKNWPECTFEGWYNGDTKWDFAASTVTGNTTLTARWGGSTENLVPYATVAKNDVAAAVTYANSNATATDRFYLLMDGNAIITVATTTSNTPTTATTLNRANSNLTIIGIGGERKISLSDRTDSDPRILFVLAHASASLTLGNNITLQGRDISSYTSNSYLPLVRVNAGTLTMENGSKITGHMGARQFGAVDINGTDARFYMKGGQITGNSTSINTTGAQSSGERYHATTAGVFLYDGLFDMSGGSITNNYYGGTNTSYNKFDYDLQIMTGVTSPYSVDNPSNPQFKLSGDAEIGSIVLTLGYRNSQTSVTTPHIQLADNFTGSVSALNFALLTSVLVNTIRPAWTSEPIRYFITGPGAIAANISKFARINWSAAAQTAAIATHELACNPGEGIYLKAK